MKKLNKLSVVSLVLVGALMAGCATHMPMPAAAGSVPGSDDESGSVAANILYIPGRGLICGAGGLMAGVVMLITFGQSYESASEVLHGACSGPWSLTPSDIRQAIP